jgi:hypothetical protein
VILQPNICIFSWKIMRDIMFSHIDIFFPFFHYPYWFKICMNIFIPKIYQVLVLYYLAEMDFLTIYSLTSSLTVEN